MTSTVLLCLVYHTFTMLLITLVELRLHMCCGDGLFSRTVAIARIEYFTAGREPLWSRPKRVATLVAPSHFFFDKKKTAITHLFQHPNSNCFFGHYSNFYFLIFGMASSFYFTIVSMIH